MKHTFTSQVRYSECGPDSRLRLDNIINYFQDCSVFQTEAVGLGPKVWKARKAGWLIVSWRIRIHEYPEMLSPVTAATWAYSFHGMEGDRNFTLTAEDGRVLAEAMSRWIFYDMVRQRPIRVPEDEKAAYGLEEPLDFTGYPKHIVLPEGAEEETPFEVSLTQLDTNNHVNNEEYIHMAMAYLPRDFVVRELLVDYHAQARLGDRICPHVFREDDRLIVSLDSEEGKAYSVIEFRA